MDNFIRSYNLSPLQQEGIAYFLCEHDTQIRCNNISMDRRLFRILPSSIIAKIDANRSNTAILFDITKTLSSALRLDINNYGLDDLYDLVEDKVYFISENFSK